MLKIAGAADESADILAASFAEDNPLVLVFGKSQVAAEVDLCTSLVVE